LGFRASNRDITDRKQAEEGLQGALSEIKVLKEQLEAENVYLREEMEVKYQHEDIIGKSDKIKHVLLEIEQVAGTESTVLLLGETGTGKELIARTIHNLSPRKSRTLVKVNCAALPSTLVENELFGSEKGAYTGALRKRTGRFEVANGSTIFLDEISELPLELQAKLLRVLQDGHFERLGSSKTIGVDVRVIAATNKDLAKAVKNGQFREDLYYRLNVFPITIPPLRERIEDIPLLVWAFVKEFGEIMGKTIEQISQKSMDSLQRYYWPGNVRELRNVIERAIILCNDPILPIEVPKGAFSSTRENMTLTEVERNHIISILDMTGWRVRGKNGAAEILGLKPTTLDSKMAKLGIRRKN
jgi:transcriptional regulator with GAF, ATPase, and Fis domain